MVCSEISEGTDEEDTGDSLYSSTARLSSVASIKHLDGLKDEASV